MVAVVDLFVVHHDGNDGDGKCRGLFVCVSDALSLRLLSEVLYGEWHDIVKPTHGTYPIRCSHYSH